MHRAGQRCFELLALIGSPQLSSSFEVLCKLTSTERKSASNINILLFKSYTILAELKKVVETELARVWRRRGPHSF